VTRPVKFRTSPHIVAYWEHDRLVLHQFASGTRAVVDPGVIQILDTCHSWLQLDQITSRTKGRPEEWVKQAVVKLASASFLQRSDAPEAPEDRAFDAWREWNPAAGFFHSATRDPRWPQPDEREALEAGLRDKARGARPPAASRSQRGLSLVSLPKPERRGEFPEILLSRRTWRGFSDQPLKLADLSTLLWLTAGVQAWGVSSAGERVPFKSSPSAGSKHPIELFVLARKVEGLPSGVYHYGTDRHRLAVISRRLTSARVQKYLGNQWQFRDAAAVVVMVAVMSRTQWTYATPRAYRSVLAEAGHVCQTFCLTATWLDLAPFCTMALADREIEKALGIDGVSEAALYAAGVGVKPADGVWVQWPEHAPGQPYTPLKASSPRRRPGPRVKKKP
jgi:SagB-type dehydrogenase family enzyme